MVYKEVFWFLICSFCHFPDGAKMICSFKFTWRENDINTLKSTQLMVQNSKSTIIVIDMLWFLVMMEKHILKTWKMFIFFTHFWSVLKSIYHGSSPWDLLQIFYEDLIKLWIFIKMGVKFRNCKFTLISRLRSDLEQIFPCIDYITGISYV